MTPARADNPLRGILMIMAAVLFIAGQEAVAKLLTSQGMPLSQVIWARYASHMLVMLAVMLPRHGLSCFRSNRPGAQIGRSMLLLADTVLYFWGLTLLSLVEVTAIVFIAPILVVVLSWPLLGEKLDRAKLLAVAVGFIGVLIVVRPGLGGLSWPALLIVGAAVCIALFNIATRRMKDTDPASVTMLYTAAVGTVAASLWVPFDWMPPTADQWLLMGLIGVLGGIGHGLLVVAHQDAPASTVAPFMYVQILWAVGLGWLVFGTWPDFPTLLGAAVIVAGGIYLLTRERRKAAR